MTARAQPCLRRALPVKPEESFHEHNIYLLESELTMAVASLNVLGSLPQLQSLHLVAGWAGYEYTLYGLAPGAWHSAAYAEVARSVRDMAACINQKDWEDGCLQARYELSLL